MRQLLRSVGALRYLPNNRAYAFLDYATDIAIQKTLRTEFSRDTTIITIAHRLQTIIDYDKIVRVQIPLLVHVC